jgi:23S rRNA (cytosine1962-C5)-methyltransferase
MPSIHLKPGREKSLLRRHPWIFSGAIDQVRGNPGLGETVEVYDSKGVLLARAAYSPHSQIRARVWSWEPGELVDAAFFRRLLTAVRAARQALNSGEETDAFRMVHGESDGLPGLIVDRYGTVLVVQYLTQGGILEGPIRSPAELTVQPQSMNAQTRRFAPWRACPSGTA